MDLIEEIGPLSDIGNKTPGKPPRKASGRAPGMASEAFYVRLGVDVGKGGCTAIVRLKGCWRRAKRHEGD